MSLMREVAARVAARLKSDHEDTAREEVFRERLATANRLAQLGVEAEGKAKILIERLERQQQALAKAREAMDRASAACVETRQALTEMSRDHDLERERLEKSLLATVPDELMAFLDELAVTFEELRREDDIVGREPAGSDVSTGRRTFHVFSNRPSRLDFAHSIHRMRERAEAMRLQALTEADLRDELKRMRAEVARGRAGIQLVKVGLRHEPVERGPGAA
jgi:hypothetical protein